MSRKVICGLLVFLIGVSLSWAQEKQEKKAEAPATGAAATPAPLPPHTFAISPQDAARKNPVKFTQVSVDRGKKLYMTQCALCHGKDGDGKGEMVEDLKITPPDFRKAETLSKRTDGELFAIIGVGKDPMPGQAGRLTDPHKWNLVNFLRSLSGKTPEKATGKEPEENVILVPQ
jgi:mono/diheme cytochrome c family protein